MIEVNPESQSEFSKEAYENAVAAFEKRKEFMRRIEGASEIGLSIEALIWMCAFCMHKIDMLEKTIEQMKEVDNELWVRSTQ